MLTSPATAEPPNASAAAAASASLFTVIDMKLSPVGRPPAVRCCDNRREPLKPGRMLLAAAVQEERRTGRTQSRAEALDVRLEACTPSHRESEINSDVLGRWSFVMLAVL